MSDNTLSNNTFYTPEDVRPLYGEIVRTYQKAFAGEPWNEVSKCIDPQQRCSGGFSAVAIGGLCNTCGLRPTRPAYEAAELVQRFDELGSSYPTVWYTEQNWCGQLLLAALAWEAPASEVARAKYADVPKMRTQLINRLGNGSVMWLDEVFANKDLRPTGNLQNFKEFVPGLAGRLGCSTVAYRTIAPSMTAVARRDFGENAVVWRRKTEVPDWRDFVIISLE